MAAFVAGLLGVEDPAGRTITFGAQLDLRIERVGWAHSEDGDGPIRRVELRDIELAGFELVRVPTFRRLP